MKWVVHVWVRLGVKHTPLTFISFLLAMLS